MNQGKIRPEGHREVVISGKISKELNNAVCSLIDGSRFRTKNDVLEYALIELIRRTETLRKEEGC